MSDRPARSNDCEVMVIGAGPYGLAVAAHLKEHNIATRVFGDPMSFWRRHMPKGMKLRSPWNATRPSPSTNSTPSTGVSTMPSRTPSPPFPSPT